MNTDKHSPSRAERLQQRALYIGAAFLLIWLAIGFLSGCKRGEARIFSEQAGSYPAAQMFHLGAISPM